MDDETLAKWFCLYEAVNTISDLAEKNDIPLENALKPIPIKKYVDEEHSSVYERLQHEKESS